MVVKLSVEGTHPVAHDTALRLTSFQTILGSLGFHRTTADKLDGAIWVISVVYTF